MVINQRPASNESYKNTFSVMRLAMGMDYEELMVTTYHVDFSPEANGKAYLLVALS